MVIKPGYVGFSYTDAKREQFDAENTTIIKEKNYPDVVFFGDSLLWYMPLKREVLPWTWANRGIPGDVSKFMQLRFTADVLQLQPKAVVILAGINDIINVLLHDAPYEEGRIEDATNAVCANIATMAASAHVQQIDVYIGSVLPIKTPMGYAIDNDTAKTAILAVNDCLRQLCVVNGYHYINFYPSFVDHATGYIAERVTIDGVHLRKSGYRTFLTLLQEKVKINDEVTNERGSD